MNRIRSSEAQGEYISGGRGGRDGARDGGRGG